MGTSPEIIVRRMTAADISTVYEIETESFKTAWQLDFFESCLKSNEHICLVAELDKKILLYSIIQTSQIGEVYLLKFAIEKSFRRQGLGKNFLLKLIEQIRNGKGQILAMLLHVNTKNVAAIRLYESCGFKVFERIENFYANDNENAFMMERKI